MTHCLKQQKEFYTETLGLPLLSDSKESFTLFAGTTKLRFTQTKEDIHPCYHFAFNISEHKVQEARDFLLKRTTLLEAENVDVFDFESWNAHALYFYDPAGNIVEWIARHNLLSDSTGAFTTEDILGVSEVGLPVSDVLKVTQSIRDAIGIPLWKGDGQTFQPVGDEHGLFIVVKSERTWFPTREKKADVFPVTVKIRGAVDRSYSFEQNQYQIEVVST